MSWNRGYKEDGKPGEIIATLSSADEFNIILPASKADTGLATIEKRIFAPGKSSLFVCGMSVKDKQLLMDMDEGVQRKTLALLWAYLGRVDLSDMTLDAEKLEVAPIAYTLNDALIVMSLAFGNMTPLLSSYKLSQSLIQAISPDLPPLLQLPYFNPDVVQAVEGETPRTHMTVQDFMALPAEFRRKRACGPNLLTEAQLRSAESIASQLPYLKVERAFFKVHGERHVTPGSLVQFIVKTRMIPPGTTEIPPVSDQALEELDKPPKQQSDEEVNQKRIAPPLAHSPFFARDHSPRWHLFLADGKQGKVVVPPSTFTTFDKPLFTEDGKPTFNVQTLAMTFGAPPQPGTYTFLMHLVCDSYLGFDTMMNVKMVVEDVSKAEAIEDEGEISEPEEGKIESFPPKFKSNC
jgi:translocation protein SEC63